MIELGGKPTLWHIMKIYAIHGINDFNNPHVLDTRMPDFLREVALFS